jgi:hypothetical protein
MTKTRYIQILIGIALFCNFNNLKSQHVIPERKDNVIVITADTSTLTNFDKFAKHLIDNGYHQCPHTPCIFKHETRDIAFVLVVDDFGIKYKNPEEPGISL